MRHWVCVVAFASSLCCEASSQGQGTGGSIVPDVGTLPIDVAAGDVAEDVGVSVSDIGAPDGLGDGSTATDAGPVDSGPILLPVLIGCGGKDKYTESVCTPDGYCTINDEGNPEVICCDEPCNGEAGGLGKGGSPFYDWNWVKHPTLPDDAPCKEIGTHLRTWIYGLNKPRRQWAELTLRDRKGNPCSAPIKNIVIECWPPLGEIESVMEESGDRLLVRCPLVAQGDGRIRQAYGRWLHPEYCGEGNTTAHPRDPVLGYCDSQYAWVTPETAPWENK